MAATRVSRESQIHVTPDLEHLYQRVHALTGIDLGAYKQQQMQRRLRSYVERLHLKDAVDLAMALEDPARLEEFKAYVTINVSEFFRNPERFCEFCHRVIPALPVRALTVWSAGCANGAEPFSIAMLLRRERPGFAHSIWATDIDGPSLEGARVGVYRAEDVKHVPPDILEREFSREQSRYTVRLPVRRLVTVEHHDLLRDPYPEAKMDLIVCRNVLIYFSEEARNRIFRGFSQALIPGGFLFVGSTETLFHPERFGLKQFKPFFYRAIENGRNRPC